MRTMPAQADTVPTVFFPAQTYIRESYQSILY
jgi:hypothetical protein